jgi:hypothetical protein
MYPMIYQEVVVVEVEEVVVVVVFDDWHSAPSPTS